MDGTASTSNSVRYDSGYVRRLLLERHHIYAKLTNPGGSIILRGTALVDHDRPLGYSTEIGSDFHLDLIELGMVFDYLIEEKGLTKKEIRTLLTVLDGMDSRQAAEYLNATGTVSVRKVRERGIRKLRDTFNEGKGAKPRRIGD